MNRTAALEALARLPPADLAAIRPCLSCSLVRELRLAERDAAIRAAVPFIAHLSRTAGPRLLEQHVKRYLASSDWRRDRNLAELPLDVPAVRRAVHLIACRLSDGEPLGWRQLANILAGHRG